MSFAGLREILKATFGLFRNEINCQSFRSILQDFSQDYTELITFVYY